MMPNKLSAVLPRMCTGTAGYDPYNNSREKPYQTPKVAYYRGHLSRLSARTRIWLTKVLSTENV